MHDLHITDATRDDVPTLLNLLAMTGLTEPENVGLDKALAAWDTMKQQLPGARVLMASRCDGMVLGTLTLVVMPMLGHGGAPSALVEDVAVHPATQRGGIGRQLIEAAMAIARDAGCYKLALSSHLRRDEAHAFYEALGFERHGVSFGMSLADVPHDVRPTTT